ncbi:MAG: type II toxin-antitoxin system VapC family toxin [Acidobacteria bacterium]|nr:type II toxin-antitoxin system VapC family toxin [Acidobacteriota bacterium]
MSGRNLVDSSGWLEFLTGSERADLFADAITDTENLIVPVISVYEVVKRTLRDGNEADAVNAISAMVVGRLVDLDLSLALEAARYKLPLADSIIYATSQRFNATLWTQDHHFQDLPEVRYFAK